MSVFPEIQSGYDYGNDLLNDKQLSEEEKDKVEHDMDNHGQEFQTLQKDINDEQDRSEIEKKLSTQISLLCLCPLIKLSTGLRFAFGR